MSNILFQITEEDIRRSIERHNSPLNSEAVRADKRACPFDEEDVQDIIKTVSDMEVTEVVDDFILQYAVTMLQSKIEECLDCPDVRKCREGLTRILEGMKTLGKRPIIISGRN